MASQPKTAEPDIVGQIVLLRPDEIDASGRLRPIDPVWASALAGVMKAEGQRTPIEVCRLPGKSGYKLVTGGHRHAAAEINGMYLRAEIVDNGAAERRLREISENLLRRDLNPLDRAAFVAELVAVHKVRAGLNADQDGRTGSVNARWQKALQSEAADTNDTMSFVYGWSDQVADQLGFSKRTVERDLLLIRRISPTIIESLRRRNHPVLRNAAQLRALAKLEEGQQKKAVSLLFHNDMNIAGAPFDKVTDAIAAMADKPRPSPDAKRLSTFIGTYGRMPLAEKKGALGQLAGLLPAGFEIVESNKPAASATAAAAKLREALSVAFDLIVKLSDGEPVEDDDIRDAHMAVQFALLDTASVVSTKGEKA